MRPYIFLLLLIILLSTPSGVVGQDRFTGYQEPSVQIGYSLTDSYAHTFGVDERIYWYREGQLGWEVKQLDLSHFSDFSLNEKNRIALGIQYRFEKIFEKEAENELRFTEEYTYFWKASGIDFGHRLRAEQRIRSSFTAFRFRYRLDMQFPLRIKEKGQGGINFKANTETLITLAQMNPISFEQRIAVGIGCILNDVTEIELVAEYRLGDYTQNLSHELFFVTGLILNL